MVRAATASRAVTETHRRCPCLKYLTTCDRSSPSPSMSTTSSWRSAWRASSHRGSAPPRSGSSSTARSGRTRSQRSTELGFDVFCDLKLYDIPTTVNKASRVIGSLGAKYLNLHAQGGVGMLRAGAEGLKEGAADAGVPEPLALAVTVLTSDDDAPPHILGKRVQAALESDCDGIVCAAVTCAKRSSTGRACSPPFRASVPQERRSTNKRAPRHHARRSRPAPISSSSDAPSRRPMTRRRRRRRSRRNSTD